MSSHLNHDMIWAGERLLPTFTRPQHLTVYDMRHTSRETQLSVATLTGLINRAEPRIYLSWRPSDPFWLKEALGFVPQELSPLSGEEILDHLLSNYRDCYTGLIIYDPVLPDSVNIATMLAGQHDGVIVSPEQAEQLRHPPHALPILDDLRIYHWRNRVQAYRWAQRMLLKVSAPRLIAGIDPDITLGLRSFLVATRAFIHWLHPLGALPDPTAGWTTERCLLKQILHDCAPGTMHLGWFLQEGSGVTLSSHEAIPVIASDYFSNLEIWLGAQPEPVAFPVQPAMPASIPPTSDKKVYVSFTMSEGDNLQYVQERMLNIWRDPARGSIPIGWPIALMLAEAAPALVHYYQRTVTPNDELLAGPSGLAYIYPSKWPSTQLSSFLQQTGRLMRQLNLSLVQILDSNFWFSPLLMYRALSSGSGMALVEKSLQERFIRELKPYGIRGLVSGSGQEQGSWRHIDGIPVYQNVGLVDSVDRALTMIKGAAGTKRPAFINVYALAWQLGPTQLQQIMQQLGNEYEAVTPGALLAMLPEASSNT